MPRTRRSILAGTVGAGATAIAGCLGGGDSGSFADHPSTADVETQPTLGSLEAPGVIVAFEDPSCPSCRRFETGAFPRIESELIETGDAAFVFRTLDIIYRWAEPASQVLAAAFAADAAAFWSLKRFYYENQSRFDTNNVFEQSSSFLEAETGVDAAAVIDAARAKEHDDLIQQNREAADAADVGGTPQFFLFRDGEFRTEVSGPQDYAVFANALGFET